MGYDDQSVQAGYAKRQVSALVRGMIRVVKTQRQGIGKDSARLIERHSMLPNIRFGLAFAPLEAHGLRPRPAEASTSAEASPTALSKLEETRQWSRLVPRRHESLVAASRIFPAVRERFRRKPRRLPASSSIQRRLLRRSLRHKTCVSG
jgi:hypothetical protein